MAMFRLEYGKKHMFPNEEEAKQFADFSIEQLSETLPPGQYINMICEGY